MRASGWTFAIPILFGAICASTASASLVWDWSYSGSGIAASGTFITVDTPDTSGGYLITALTGMRNGVPITVLQPTGTPIPGNEPFTVDNLVFTSTGAQLTIHGFGFGTSDGTFANPFYADFLPSPGYLEFYSVPATHFTTELPVVFSATPASTPEPGTYALFFAGFALCGFGRWRAKRRLS